jgi:hypothetical protein
VRVVKADSGYDYALGDQTGMIGTVVRVLDSGDADVKFDDSAEDWYYYSSEIELVPAPVRKFKAGDTVRFTKSGSDFSGQEGTVTHYDNHGLVNYTVTKPSDGGNFMNFVGAVPRMNERDLELVPQLTAAEQVLQDSEVTVGDKMTVTKGHHKGKVATVVSGSSGGTFIKADLPGERGYPFYPEELEKFVEPAFAVGDRVEFTENYGRSYRGDAGTIRKTEPGETGEGELYYIDVDRGHTSAAFGRRIKLSTKPKPAPKFKVGDWVKVQGYDTSGDSGWEGRKGKIETVSADMVTYIVDFEPSGDGGYSGGGFNVKHLVATEAPAPKSKFKVGDWVEITGWGDNDGEKLQITEVPAGADGYYKFEGKPKVYGFSARHLKATTAPEPAHWAFSTPVGKVAQLHYADGRINRVLVRQDADNWLHLYQYSSDGAVHSAVVRSNESTKIVLGSLNPDFDTIES